MVTNLKKKKTIFVVAGGTGGHLFPAKVVAEDLTAHKKFNVFFLSDKRGFLACKPDQNTNLLPVWAKGFFGKNNIHKIISLFITGLGLLQSLYYILRYRPEQVIGFGGYTCVPVFFAALILRKKIFIHEQNAQIGRTNKFFAKYADTVFYGLPLSTPIPRSIHLGNPVRKEILSLSDLPYTSPHKDKKFHILIMGGSMGAAFFATLLPKTIMHLSQKDQSRLHITFQCPQHHIDSVKERLNQSNISYDIAPFFVNISDYIKTSHFVISRAGALSVTEMSIAGKPTLFIPYPYATDDHQAKNVRSVYVKDNKTGFSSCWMRRQNEVDFEWLTTFITNIMNDHKQLIFAAKKIKTFSVVYKRDVLEQKIMS